MTWTCKHCSWDWGEDTNTCRNCYRTAGFTAAPAGWRIIVLGTTDGRRSVAIFPVIGWAWGTATRKKGDAPCFWTVFLNEYGDPTPAETNDPKGDAAGLLAPHENFNWALVTEDRWCRNESYVEPEEFLRCDCCKQTATQERPVILWWLTAKNSAEPPIVTKVRLEHSPYCGEPHNQNCYDTANMVRSCELLERVPSLLQNYKFSPSDILWLSEITGYVAK